MIRLLGSSLIVLSFAAAGATMAGQVRGSIRLYDVLIGGFQRMRSEISYRAAPLEDLTREIAEGFPPPLKDLFLDVSSRIRVSPGIPFGVHMGRGLRRYSVGLPKEMAGILGDLGDRLGTEDAEAQITALDEAVARAKWELGELRAGGKERCRNYEIVGFCAGLAVAVILI